jgi:hypothetical protein
MNQVAEMPIMPVAEGCSVGRAPVGSTTKQCEALLNGYDAVIVSERTMITYIDRMEKLTGCAIPQWMTDQLGAQLRDLPSAADGETWHAT